MFELLSRQNSGSRRSRKGRCKTRKDSNSTTTIDHASVGRRTVVATVPMVSITTKKFDRNCRKILNALDNIRKYIHDNEFK